MESIELKINGEVKSVQVEKNWTLLYVLRDDVIKSSGYRIGPDRRQMWMQHRRLWCL